MCVRIALESTPKVTSVKISCYRSANLCTHTSMDVCTHTILNNTRRIAQHGRMPSPATRSVQTTKAFKASQSLLNTGERSICTLPSGTGIYSMNAKVRKYSTHRSIQSILRDTDYTERTGYVRLRYLSTYRSWFNGNSGSKDKILEKTTASATAKGSVDKSDKDSKSKKADNDKTDEERTTPVIEENVVVAMQEDGEPVHITTYSTVDEDGKNVAHNIDGPEPHQPEFAKDLLPKGVTIKKGAPKQAKRKQSSIPKVAWKWEDEFDTWREPRTFQITSRIARDTFRAILDPASMFLLGTAMATVVALAAYEGALTLNPNFLFGGDVTALKYIGKYTYENTVSSVVWGTKPGYLIAQSMGLDPAEVLRIFSPKMMSPADASMQLQIQGAQFGRSIAGGFMVIAQLLRIVTVSVRAADEYHERVMQGHEPPLKGITGRIVRLCGKRSHTTTVSMNRMGEHIMPVFELQQFTVNEVLRRSDLRHRAPLFWSVNQGQYGTTQAWSGFLIEPCSLLRTSTGKNILYMEADCTPSKQLLFMDKAGQDVDLTIEDACQGFRMLEHRAKHKGLKNFRIMRVCLGDLSRLIVSGGGHRLTLRDRLERRKEADIMLDARAFLIHKILKWCKRVSSTETNYSIVVETTNLQCFETLKSLLGEYQYTILDAFDPNLEIDTPAKDGKIQHLPRLIYYDATMQTVNATLALIDAKAVDPMKLCAVFDEFEGIDALTPLREKTKFRFEPVCTATLYDDCYRMVRAYVRLGHSVEEIQEELDVRYNNNMLVGAQLGKGWCSIDDNTRVHEMYAPHRPDTEDKSTPKK